MDVFAVVRKICEEVANKPLLNHQPLQQSLQSKHRLGHGFSFPVNIAQ
jgi:hypothetical protein